MKAAPLPEKMYYSIREVADYFEVATSLLRFWEIEFPHISPKRNAKGTRFYTPKNVHDIQLIYHLVKEKGFTLQGAKDALKKGATVQTNQEDIKKALVSVRDFLVTLRTSLTHE